ncbi:MAG TPA: ferrochelatase [Vicinamibacterales bacterium]|nr:ferrochelatase [Vicinamibacterales bacterium]
MTTGVLLMAHGTPSSLDEMPDYLTLVRGGRPPSPELVAEMRHNYAAIGGRSPLTDLTFAQAAALGARLGPQVPVAVGMRNWTPFVREAVEQLDRVGATLVIAIPLAPQFSSFSVARYFEAAAAALRPGMILAPVPTFCDHPLLHEAFAERVREAAPQPDEDVIFTAHSLPVRVNATGDRYASEVATTARGVARRAGIVRYHRAFQSAGRTPEPWMGLDLREFLGHRAARGITRCLIVPVGFVCDHTEVLFDIDVQAAETAQGLGLELRRTSSLNDSPRFVDLLESLVRERL